jgi:Tfp pilus assembly protein PilO
MQSKNRQQLLLIIVLVMVGLWVGNEIVFSRVAKLWKARAARIAELRVQLDQSRSLLQREQIVRSRWEYLRRNSLPPDASAAEQKFFQSVNKWAADSGVVITAITPQRKRDAEDYMTYQARVEAKGNLPALSRFLFELEKDPLALKLEGVELAARDKEGRELALGLQVSALVLNPPGKSL